MTDTGFEATLREYLAAVERRDAPRCAEFYAEHGTIRFGFGTVQGRPAIEEWHQARFQAEFQVVTVGTITFDGEHIAADVVGTSRIVKQWGLDSMTGRVVLRVEDGVIQDMTVELPMTEVLSALANVDFFLPSRMK